MYNLTITAQPFCIFLPFNICVWTIYQPLHQPRGPLGVFSHLLNYFTTIWIRPETQLLAYLGTYK